MENIKLDGLEYKVVKKIETDDYKYFYTLDIKHDNEIVILEKNKLEKNAKYQKVDEREYPILMNKFL